MTPRLDAIGIPSADLPASLAFYRHLGLATPEEAGSAPHAEATVGGVRVMWDAMPQPPATGGPALAFRCAEPAEVDAVYTELTQAGYRGRDEPWDAPWGQRYATVLDPDGHPVDLFAWAAG